jgi:hypothetical protein
MSVASMTELANDSARAPSNALSLIVAYIPSEAIAVYIAALGILIPGAQATPEQVGRVRLVCFFAGLAVAVVITFANFDAANLEVREAYRRRTVVAILAAVAFLIYAAATPSFFYGDTLLTIPFTQWAAAAAIVSAVVMPVVAKALGVRDMATRAAAPAA